MLNKIKKIHFVGIGGVGMSALADVMLDKGYTVSGSDLNTSPVVKKLEQKGAHIYLGHAAENVKDAEALVISSAIKEDNPEILKAKTLGLPILHRSDILAFLLNQVKGIAVAGAHGKTTTSSMISVVMEYGKMDPTIIIGGFVDYLKGNAKLGKSDYLVAEADESDGSFLKFYPHISVITNIEDDHMDHYGSRENIIKAFKQYVENLDKETGLAVICVDNEQNRNMLKVIDRKYITYGIDNPADYQAVNIHFEGPQTHFTVTHHGEVLGDITLNIPGVHNVENALATVAVCHHLGRDLPTIAGGLLAFTGTQRRFQTKFKNKDLWIVDDYAHHPTEIKTSIQAAAQASDKRLIVVFQPHRYSRTKLLRKEFGECFDGADLLILTDIYAASESPIPGITGETLVEETKAHGLNPIYIKNLDDIVKWLEENHQPGDLIITMGAGNVYTVGEKLAAKMK